MKPKSIHAFFLIFTLFACAPVPTASIQGKVTATDVQASDEPDLRVGLLYYGYRVRGEETVADGHVIRSVRVTGEFPSAFGFEVEGAPPAGAFRSTRLYDRELVEAYDIAVGHIVAFRDLDAPMEVPNLRGGSIDHIVVYLPEPALEGSHQAWFLGAALPAGYHLLKTDVRTDEELAAYQACLDCENMNGTDGCDFPEETREWMRYGGMGVDPGGVCGQTRDVLAGPAPAQFDTEVSVVLPNDPSTERFSVGIW